MKKLMSTRYSAGAFNFAMLFLRFGMGILLAKIGYQKLVNFNHMLVGPPAFHSFIGLGPKVELCLLIFAEFFCAIFVLLGLFTRLSAIPIIIAMSVAVFKAHGGDLLGEGQHAALFLMGYFVLLLVGPGKISVDGMTGK